MQHCHAAHPSRVHGCRPGRSSREPGLIDHLVVQKHDTVPSMSGNLVRTHAVGGSQVAAQHMPQVSSCMAVHADGLLVAAALRSCSS